MSSPSTGHGRGGSAHERMRPSGEFVGVSAALLGLNPKYWKQVRENTGDGVVSCGEFDG